MHVRVAWEIYHHQQKQQADLKPGGVGSKTDLLRPPSHVFPGGLVHPSRPPHELPPQFHRGPPYEQSPHPGSLFAPPPSHLARYQNMNVPGKQYFPHSSPPTQKTSFELF